MPQSRQAIAIETMKPEDIVAMRQRLGINQPEFGALINASTNSVCRWEKGNPIRSRAHKMALLKFRDVDQHAEDIEDRIRTVRYALMVK